MSAKAKGATGMPDLDAFVRGIQKTGYPLEAMTVQTLQADGWNVISNKYYVDNDEERPREVDILAYKVTTSNPDFDLYTVLIISCKKNEHNSWAFLTRDLNRRDPNADWEPAHFFIQHSPLEYMLKKNKRWSSDYHEQARKRGVAEVLRMPSVEIFAVQEMSNGDKNGHAGKPSGDSQIFNSTMSLMKAQFYEMSVRRERVREKPAVYQFNLVSLADTNFVRLHFGAGEVTPSAVDVEHYIARYIFNKKEVFARILFVRSNEFERTLKDYNRLHSANCEIIGAQLNAFYQGIMKDRERIAVLREEFTQKLASEIRNQCYLNRRFPVLEVKVDHFYWDEARNLVQMDTSADEDDLRFLNGSECRERTAKLLKSIFRYEGDFEFINDIPF